MRHASGNKAWILVVVLASFILGAFTSEDILNAITRQDVKAASRIIGIEMNNPEIDSLLPDLNEFRDAYIKSRAAKLDNSVAPALVFDPIPDVYIKKLSGRNAIALKNPGKVELPKDKDMLAWYSLQELAYLIREKKISSVELTKFFIARLKKYDPMLKCVITITEDLALEQAKKADAEIAKGNYKGTLHGIPYGIKDLFATKKYKTTWGAEPYKDQVLDYNATVVEKLNESGAVMVAKLTLGALAMGDEWYGGMTRNPWDMSTGSSGSSAGSASAVAAGLVPFAIGTETLGSIVSPSTVCGTAGLRPTFGRVSRHGAMALSWSMDKIGPICKTAEETAIVFNAIRGRDDKDLSTYDAPFYYRPNIHNTIKVGYVKSDFEKDYPFKKQDSLSLRTLKQMGIELIPIELPNLPDISPILLAEAAAAFDDLTLSNQDDELKQQAKNAWPNIFRGARFIPAVEYIQANRLRTQLIADMEKLFEKVDAYVHPSWASQSLRITNFTGHPCIVVPNGFQANGHPTSISFTGKWLKEGEIISLAEAYQKRAGFYKKHPTLKK
ncbi:MAG: amidase [Saprospiraceae bacterium]|nr:amidase [Saprospiraceae bacterium]